jgi:hypothetical protein
MLTASLKPYWLPILLVISSLGWVGLISVGVGSFFGSSFTTVLLIAAGLVFAGAVFYRFMAREARNAPDMTELQEPNISPVNQRSIPLSKLPPGGRIVRKQLSVPTLSCRTRLQDAEHRPAAARRRARSKVVSTL